MLKKISAFALLAASIFVAQPALAQGIGHSLFMRGQIVDLQAKDAVLCIGKADGAKAAQVLDVYRVRVSHVSPKTPGGSSFRRERVGSVKIDTVFDDHFARASVTSGSVALNDIVELRMN